jgi:hypothetical protein
MGPNHPTKPASFGDLISGTKRCSRNTIGSRRNRITRAPKANRRPSVTGHIACAQSDQGSTVPRVVNMATSSTASIPSEKCECRSCHQRGQRGTYVFMQMTIPIHSSPAKETSEQLVRVNQREKTRCEKGQGQRPYQAGLFVDPVSRFGKVPAVSNDCADQEPACGCKDCFP